MTDILSSVEKTIARLRIVGVATFVVLAFLSWYIGYNQEAEWVRRVFAPDYEPTLAIIDELINKGGEIDDTNPRFENILGIIEIRLIYPYPTDCDLPNGPSIEMRIEEGARIIFGEVYERDPNEFIPTDTWENWNPLYSYEYDSESNLISESFLIAEEDIKEDLCIKFLQEPLWRWKNIMFSMGVILCFGFLYSSWAFSRNSEPNEVGIYFALYWIFATIAGFYIGIVINQIANEYYNTYMIQLYIAIPQWLILRTQISRARYWILAGFFGYFFVNVIDWYAAKYMIENYQEYIRFLGDFPWFTMAKSTIFISSMALFQWFVLRRHFFKAGWWVIASAIGFFIGLKIDFPLYDYFNIELNQLAAITFPLISWATMATFTGITLYWLLKNHRRNALPV